MGLRSKYINLSFLLLYINTIQCFFLILIFHFYVFGCDIRIAVVTGANKGIGLEISRRLASKGVGVVLTARDVKRGTEAVEELKASGFSHVVFHQLDVTEPTTIASLVDFLRTQFGKLDILVFVLHLTILRNGWIYISLFHLVNHF